MARCAVSAFAALRRDHIFTTTPELPSEGGRAAERRNSGRGSRGIGEI